MIATPPAAPQAAPPVGPAEDKKRILLVEDEANMMELLKYRLEENHYAVATASDGYAALAQVRAFKPQLIILDLMLPKIDGYTICRLLKFNDELRSIPVIILSARANDEDVRRGMAMGADAYMTKPYEPPALLAKIQELMSRDPNAVPEASSTEAAPAPAQ
jgi:DNA-binding response OmpR family regulator